MKLSPFSFAATAVSLLVGCSATDHQDLLAPTDEAPARVALADRVADERALAEVAPVTFKDICGPARGRTMRCLSKVVTDAAGEPVVAHAPQGLTPQDLKDAYKLPATGGNGRIVGIIDAFDAPNAEQDMNTYRTQFGLPPCTTANGCFRKVNQDGQASPLPAPDSGWVTEISVDLDMVSATCPDCKIVLVEARSSDSLDLGPSLATAAKLGAAIITNSYAGGEIDPDAAKVNPYYDQPGVLVLAASGDWGYDRAPDANGNLVPQVSSPAALPTVMAVGGTTLAKSNSTRGWAEQVWKGGGSGCSQMYAKPSWQKDTGCTKKMVADIAAAGDPATGVAYYNGGWQVVGGTSVASPMAAGILAVLNVTDLSFPYTHASALFDVTAGSNGNCGSYQCTAGAGYDGPSGMGTPNGAAIRALPMPDAGARPDAGVDGSSSGAGGGSSTGAGGSGGGGGAGGTGSATSTTTGMGGGVATGSSSTTGGTSSGGAGGAGGIGGTTTTTGGSSTAGTSSSTSSSSGGPPGTGGSTTSGASGGAMTTTVTTTGGHVSPPPDGGGCAMRPVRGSRHGATWLGLAAAAWLTRRRRRNTPPHSTARSSTS